MNELTRRTLLRRSGILGGLLALKAEAVPTTSSRRFTAIDTDLAAGTSRSDVTGALFTQILPFYDERVVALYGAFERGLYAGLA